MFLRTRSFFLAALFVAMPSKQSLTSCIDNVPFSGHRFLRTKYATAAKSPAS